MSRRDTEIEDRLNRLENIAVVCAVAFLSLGEDGTPSADAGLTIFNLLPDEMKLALRERFPQLRS
jgi:uncharacterized membrane protein